MTTPRILIMVLSYSEHPYDHLLNAQKETWDSIDVPGVRSLFYYGKGKLFASLPFDDTSFYGRYSTPSRPWSETVSFLCSDDYYKMHWKFKLALDHAFDVVGNDWDIIFRTNSSSYVNKRRLVDMAQTLPRTGLYAGWTMKDTNHDGGDCVSGAGIFMSKDVAQILRNDLQPGENCEEDVLIGRLIRPYGVKAIDERSRVDYTYFNELLSMTYHIRFKSSDRIVDAKNMIRTHADLKHNL